jgi:hypothetical protein
METAPQEKKMGGGTTVVSPTVPDPSPKKAKGVGAPPFHCILSPLHFLSCTQQPAVLHAEETTSRGRELVVVRAPGLGPTLASGAAGGGGEAPHPTPTPTVVELLHGPLDPHLRLARHRSPTEVRLPWDLLHTRGSPTGSTLKATGTRPLPSQGGAPGLLHHVP